MVSSARPASGRRIGVVQLIGLLLAFLLTAGLGGVLTAGLVMPVVATTNVITSTSVNLFEDLPTELAEVPLSEKSTVLASDGTVLAEFYFQNRIVVTLDQISQPMRDAVIAVEDHRFYEHGGIDPTGLLRALVNNATNADSGTQGGSTLTQQYVKNALIQNAQQGEDEEAIAAAIAAARVSEGTEGYARKLAEAKIAIALEQRLTKDQILERYLNIAQFGHAQIYGVEAAAEHFFSVHAIDLNYLQAATIAGITRAPGLYDPEWSPVKAEERRNTVLGLMHDQGKITDEEYQTGIATPLASTLVIGQLAGVGCVAANAVSSAGYFCDYVTKIIINDPAFGETKPDRSRLLYRGGLTITTTLDRGLQAMADEEVKAGIPVDDPSGVGSAISVVQPGTGYVLAMAQNRNYGPSSPEPGSRSTLVNYNTDNMYGSASGFPTGSTFKPFTLMEWFKQGHALNEMVNGTKRLRNENEFVACGARLGSKPWPLGNSEGGQGIMTVLDATRNSVNNAYADIASQLDLCNIMTGAEEIGVHLAGGIAGDGPFGAIPSNVIGTDSIAPLTMAASFATFAANGTYCDPIAIISVVDSNGNQLPVPAANCRPALDPGIAAAVSFTLSHVFEGTGRGIGALSGGRVAAGKTGTTSANEDTWFVAYTPQISTAVWVGYPDEMKPMQGVTINGRPYRNVYGSSIAGPTWKRFMERALVGHENIGFPAPPGQYIQGVQVKVPNVAGRTVADAIQILEDAGFRVKTGLTAFSDIQPGLVARTDPGAGASLARGSVLQVITSIGPDPTTPVPGPGGPGGDHGHGG